MQAVRFQEISFEVSESENTEGKTFDHKDT